MDLPVDAEGWLELVVRCWDNSMNTQPTFVRSTWQDSIWKVFLLLQILTERTGIGIYT